MKIARNYLTSEELTFIVNSMLEKETAVEREIVKIGLIAQLVCDNQDTFKDCDDCNDIYDIIIADNTIDFNTIKNYDIIDKIVAKELSVTNVVKDFVRDINEKLDKMGDIDLEGAITQLKEITEKKMIEDGDIKKVQQFRTNKRVSR